MPLKAMHKIKNKQCYSYSIMAVLQIKIALLLFKLSVAVKNGVLRFKIETWFYRLK